MKLLMVLVTLLFFVFNGAYILYRFSASKIKFYRFIILGLLSVGVIFLSVAIMDRISSSSIIMDMTLCMMTLVQFVLSTLFLQQFRNKKLRNNIFLAITTITFCYFVKMFVSVFVVEVIFSLKDELIGVVIGECCVIPVYFLLISCLDIQPQNFLISEQETLSDELFKPEDTSKPEQPTESHEERDFEAEQNRLVLYANLLMIMFYGYNNFIRLTVFGSRFDFRYVVFTYAFLFVALLYGIHLKYKDWENQRLLKYKDYLLVGLKTYAEEVDKSYQSVRAFRHDFTNILISMRETIETQKIEKVRETYAEILERSHITLDENRKEVAKLANIKVLELKSVLSAKILQAEIRNITIELEIPEVIETFWIRKLDIVRVFGVLLDNAIEAAAETDLDRPVVKVAIFNKADIRCCIVENSMVQEKLPTRLIFKDGYSTKGKERGHGLANLETILASYPRVNYHIQAKHYQFRIELEMKGR